MKSKNCYRWECHHDSGSGKDRECCNSKGRLTTLESAIKGAATHNSSHRWCGWGYPPSNWVNKTVNVFRVTPTGREKVVVLYDDPRLQDNDE
jgi:hypothetical protein